jgi:hypothetical protein
MDGISLELFNKIKPIILECKNIFEIELTDGEIPADYQVIKALKEN